MVLQVEEAPAGLTSEVLSLGRLLSRCERVEAPRYQRPYSWTDAEVGRLMEDLRGAFEAGAAYYFVGTVVLTRDPGGRIEVVDGQQRFATFGIVLAGLAEALGGADAAALRRLFLAPDDGPRLRLRPVDQPFFAASLAGSAEAPANDPQRAIARAAAIVREALAELPGAGALGRFAHFILNQVTINLIETEDHAGAPRLFLVLNDTGADLSAADLVKASLFERAELNEAEAETAGARWDGLIDTMGRKGVDELLSFMPAITRGAEPAAYPNVFGVPPKEFLDNVDPGQFLREDIHRYADALMAIRRAEVDAGMHTEEVNRRIRCMQLLKMKLWLGPAVAAVADHEGAKERLLPFFEGLERLAFACFLGVVKSHAHVKRFLAVLKARRSPVGLLGPGGALELTQDEQLRMLRFIQSSFEEETGKRRIIVLRLNSAVDPTEVVPLQSDTTVEHILPQDCTEFWERAFPDPSVRRDMTHLLGNFTLITDRQNRHCGTKPYPDKRRVYFETKGAPIRALTRELRDYPDWTPVWLVQRHETLCRILAEDWRLLPAK